MQQTSKGTTHAITYYARNGRILPGSVSRGNGFNVNEQISIRVNRQTNTVEWIVGGVTRASTTNAMLSQNVNFVPYVEMQNNNDQI